MWEPFEVVHIVHSARWPRATGFDLNGRAMRSTDEASPVSSALLDLREVPLAEMPALKSLTRDNALQRVLPQAPMAPLTVAAFGSAI
jgi:FXSXX-COOH protein